MSAKPDPPALLPPVHLVTSSSRSDNLTSSPYPGAQVFILPALLPSLLGRDDELTQIGALFVQPAQRLITLVGPPGVGKTRLAQEVAQAIGDPSRTGVRFPIADSLVESDLSNNPQSATRNSQFSDGVFFVDLAAISDPALVAVTIAHVLALHESSGRTALDILIDLLHDKTILLVLDNFEQVLTAGTTTLLPLWRAVRASKCWRPVAWPFISKVNRFFPSNPCPCPI